MNQYFANLPSDELAKKIVGKVRSYNNYTATSGLANLWRRARGMFYGKHLGETGTRSTEIIGAGSEGELKAGSINIYRTLINHALALTTAQKPAYDPKAKNSDLESIQQARIFSNVLDDYVVEKRMFRHFVSAALRALVESRGCIYMTWEPSLGRPYSTEPVTGKDGQPILDEKGEPKEKVIYEGDVEIRAKSPRDVISDPRVKEKSKHKWRIVREWENKWDLAARHPEYYERIVELDSNDQINDSDTSNFVDLLQANNSDDQDLIPTYHFYHLKTDAVPNGRYMKLLAPDLWVYDGPTPYSKRLPVFDITAGDIFDTAEGYSDANDLIVLQQMVNTLASSTFTNLQAFGVQLVHLPEGCQLTPQQMNQGLAFLKGGLPGTEPKGINLTATPPALVEFQNMLENSMQKGMGLNESVAGDPGANLKSGAAIGRMQAMAIQYASNFQRSWAELLEDGGTFLLELLQDFAKTERIVALAGKNNKGAIASFTGESLSKLDRVTVDLGNPMSRTLAGKLDMADKAYEKGEINFKQYMQVADTGQFESLTEGGQSELELIQKENEMLMDGKPIMAMVGDTHLLHSKEHKAVLNDPMTREMAAKGDQMAVAIVKAAQEHIAQHEQLYMTQTPFYSMISGEPPPPPMGPPPGQDPNMPPPPQGAPAPGAPPPEPPNGPQQPADAPPLPDNLPPPPGAQGPMA